MTGLIIASMSGLIAEASSGAIRLAALRRKIGRERWAGFWCQARSAR